MKRKFMFFLSLIFPWIVLLINDDLLGALIAIVLQVTIIGWLPATIMAWRSVKKNSPLIDQTPNSERRDVQ